MRIVYGQLVYRRTNRPRYIRHQRIQTLGRNTLLSIVWDKRAILIDTGLGVSNIREVIDGLTKLPVTVITTHVHWDHIGGHKYFRSIAVHEAEKNGYRSNSYTFASGKKQYYVQSM